jgi:hypothetical protein
MWHLVKVFPGCTSKLEYSLLNSGLVTPSLREKREWRMDSLASYLEGVMEKERAENG